ncbi:MAG: MoxR family ATPase [Snowella sp.]|nr:MoxR family ATPase [Snowella sp.]
MTHSSWRLFRGDSHQESQVNDETSGSEQIIPSPDPIQRLLEIAPPSWRNFSRDLEQLGITTEIDEKYWKSLYEKAANNTKDIQRGRSFRVSQEPEGESDGSEDEDENGTQASHSDVLDAVNAALYLRRPLLVTGRPGSGKTSLAYAIAYELKLGPVLMWPITARSTLQEGLYQYDAIARLQDAQLSRTPSLPEDQANLLTRAYRDIGQYIRLGPVGTAFLPSRRPRVLLIDEIDKSDINLPNELLNLFEEGEFSIPELVRLSKQGENLQSVQSEDSLDVTIRNGKVQCGAFPFIIMTSNGERDFPPAFYRRCLRVEMPSPTEADLKAIVQAHLQADNIDQEFGKLIEAFAEQSNTQAGGLATDQLLNTVYLMRRDADVEMLKRLLFTPLSNTGQ